MLPCGTFAERYEQDKAIVRTKLQWGLFIGFLVLLFVLPSFLPIRFLGMLNMTGIILIAVVGLQITTGYAGQINLGQAAFLGTGAYMTAFAATRLGLPFWLAIPIGGIGASAFGTIFGLPAVRVKGFYLALTTLAATVVFYFMMLRLPWFGGERGIGVPAASIGGFRVTSPESQYCLIMVTTVVMIFFAYGLMRSRIGRAFTAIRDNDNAAQILGINLFYYKTLAFIIGTFFAGIAGGLWAYQFRFVSFEQISLFQSLWYIGMIIVGGMGSILGAILGTVLLRGAEEFINWLGPFLQQVPVVGMGASFAGMYIVLGGIIILFLMFEPKGLVHRWNKFKAFYRLWPFPH